MHEPEPVSGEPPRPARSILYLQAKPGMREALVEVFRRIDVLGHALQQAGCLSVEVQVPPDEGGPILVTALWSDRAAYQGWLDNPWRETSGAELAPFLAEETPAGVVYDIVLAGGDVSSVGAGAPTVDDRGGELPELRELLGTSGDVAHSQINPSPPLAP